MTPPPLCQSSEVPPSETSSHEAIYTAFYFCKGSGFKYCALPAQKALKKKKRAEIGGRWRGEGLGLLEMRKANPKRRALKAVSWISNNTEHIETWHQKCRTSKERRQHFLFSSLGLTTKQCNPRAGMSHRKTKPHDFFAWQNLGK